MTISTTMLQNDLDAMIADLPCTIVWGSQTITATRSERTLQDDVEEPGIFENVDLEVVASVDDFTGSTLPENRTVIAVDGINYYIETQAPAQDGIGVSFQLRRI